MSELRITDIKISWCGYIPFVIVYTNEKGITGIGESVVQHRGILEGQVNFLRGILIGEDPFNIERLWRDMV